MIRTLASLGTAVCLAASLSAQQPNPQNLWSADLRWTGDRVQVGTPVKLTRDNGTNSQPSFTPDGQAIVFSGLRDTGSSARSDIYRIDFVTGRERRVTQTPENENSPTVTPEGHLLAVRWVPATLFREYGLWEYAPDGTPLRGVLPGPDTTGYYTALPDGRYALTRPKSRSFTLALFDPRTGTITDVDSGVPALPAQRIPGEPALSYVAIDSAAGRHQIRRLDLTTRRATILGPTVPGRTVHAWVPGRETILMAKGNVLYALRPGRDTAWTTVATFTSAELRHASAYAVSPSGDRLILTSPVRLPLAVALRDSLEAGRPGAAAAALVAGWREAGLLAEYDVTEGALLALGRDRLNRDLVADAVALHVMVTILFPSSHAAYAALGDAHRAGGDTAAANTAYRKALELNPRRTEGERRAAEAVAEKLRPPAGR